jgi:hypothetical protein
MFQKLLEDSQLSTMFPKITGIGKALPTRLYQKSIVERSERSGVRLHKFTKCKIKIEEKM